MSVTLPAPPPALPAETYAARHRAYWEACDAILRKEAIEAEQARLAFALTQETSAQAWRTEDLRLREAANQSRRDEASAMREYAKAQYATLDAMNKPPLASDAQTLKELLYGYIVSGQGTPEALALAKARLAEFKASTAPIFQAP